MGERTYLGAYWGPRHDSIDDCASRLAQTLSRIGEISPLLSSWYRKGATRSSARRAQIVPIFDDLRELLRLGQSRGENNEALVENGLGYHVGLWNGDATDVGLSLRCGVSAEAPGLISNAFVLDFPPDTDESRSIYQRNSASQIFRAVISSWNPTWCTWTSDSLRESQGVLGNGLVVGWFTFMQDGSVGEWSGLPLGFTGEAVSDGLLIAPEHEYEDVTPGALKSVREAIDFRAS